MQILRGDLINLIHESGGGGEGGGALFVWSL